MQLFFTEQYTEEVERLLIAGDLSAAEIRCRLLLEKQPDNIEALFLLGNCQLRQGMHQAAADSFSQACRYAPDKPVLWKNLGYLRQELGDRTGALECFQHALALNSRSAELWVALASLHVADYAFDQAVVCYHRALQFGYEDPGELLNRLGTLQVYLGETEKALVTFEQAMGLASTLKQQCLYSQNRLFSMHYPATITPEAIAEAHRVWGVTYFTEQSSGAFINKPVPERRLRVGYVSPDFRMNAVCFFIQPVLKWHDQARIEVFCYANVKKPDGVTQQLQEELSLHWRDISMLDDSHACALIQDDAIDILVDLTGHGGDNRLPLFALRPAPIQMTWIGYPDTTGLKMIDYRITDALADPPGMTEHLHTEQLLRLPGCFLSYNPGIEFPSVASSPVTKHNFITFGSMSNFSKITPQMMAVWAEILRQTPQSRLVLRYRGQERGRIADDLGRQLDQQGVAADRLELLGHASSVIEQLEGYHQMDIALDTFPYNGTTTTCEALWMGVPVVTLAGRSHVARVGASLLTTVGLPHCIAETSKEYVEKTVALANNQPLLRLLRANLRQMVATSPLCDHQRFTRQVEELYRHAWIQWCVEQTTVSR